MSCRPVSFIFLFLTSLGTSSEVDTGLAQNSQKHGTFSKFSCGQGWGFAYGARTGPPSEDGGCYLYQMSHREGRAGKQSQQMGSESDPAGISACRPAGSLKSRQTSPWEVCSLLGAFVLGSRSSPLLTRASIKKTPSAARDSGFSSAVGDPG